MSDFDFGLDNKLKSWARWIISMQDGKEGWPSESFISRVMILGVTTNMPQKSKPLINSSEHENTNHLVSKLYKANQRIGQALIDFYLNPEKNIKEIAKYRGCSISTVKARVQTGRTWLSGWLAYVEEYTAENINKIRKEGIAPRR